jgi:cobalt-zinc-cadmium efflux system outer membrane protein
VARARGAYRVAGIIPNPALQLETDDIAPTTKLTVAQPTSWLLRRGADRAAGRAGIERAEADSAQMLADLGREVRHAFYGALAAGERRRLVGEQARLADSLVRLAERRLRAGDISALERDQVAQEAARAHLAASQADEAASVAWLALARSIGWTGVDTLVPRGALDAGLDSALIAAGADDEEGTDPPFLRAALADSAAARARLRAARLAQLPLPSLVAGREWGGTPEPDRSVVLGLAIPIPLWSQGREAVAMARAEAALSAAQAAEARLEIEAREGATWTRVRETAARARLARDSLLPTARRLRAGALRLFEEGRTGILPVFEAMRSEREVALDTVRELLAFQEARADLAALLGRWR